MAVATAPGQAAHHHPSRPSLVAVGTIVWLSSELMFFAALFAMYFTIRSVSTEWPPTTGAHPVHLHVIYAAIFTTILVLSSVTCQMGVFAAERGDVKKLRIWYLISLLMGATFVAGQMNEWFNDNTFSISSHAYGSVYYLTTGFHALHVIGGLAAFVFVLIRSYRGTYTPEKATTAIVVSYYWHFVDVVWIGLFAAIYLLK